MKVNKKKYWFALALAVTASLSSVGFAADLDTFEGEEYVVEVTKSALTKKEVPQSVEVITEDQIKNYGASSAEDVLRYATNIDLPQGSTNTGKYVSIRGGGKNDTLVLLNGRRIPGEGYGTVSGNTYVLDRINVNNIERIEILRGPAGALYGSDAKAGVINIIIKKAQKAGGTIGFSTSGRDMSNYYHFDSGKVGKVSVAFDANFKKTREKYWPGSTMSMYTGPQQFYTFDMDYAFDANNKLNFNVNYENTDMHSRYFKAGKFVKFQPYQVDKRSYSLAYDGKNANSEYMLDVTYGTLKKLAGSGAGKASRSEFIFRTIEGRDSIKLDKHNRLTFGADYRKNERKLSTAGNAQQYSVYVQDEMNLGKLILVPSVRYNHHDSFGSETTPNLGVTYMLSDKSRLKLDYGKAYRAPDISELYGTFGNKDLKPEKSRGYEVGFEQDFHNGSAKLSYFKRKIENEISIDMASYPYRYFNLSNNNTRGVEFEISRMLGKTLNLKANYDWLDKEDAETGAKQNYYARSSYRLSLEWTEPVKKEWSVVLWDKFTDDYKYSNTNYSFNTLNFVINKKFGKRFRAYFGVDNVLDKEIPAIYYLGRVWRCGAEMSF